MTASLGAHLRELRTRRGISLDELARITRVAPRYLTALENDAFAELPAPVFIRGFIRAYCQALGEPPHEALAQYDGRDGRTVPPPRVSAPARTDGGDARSRNAVVVSLVLLVVLGLALFGVAVVMRPGERPDRSPIEVRPAEPPPAPPAAATPAPSVPAPSAPPAQPGSTASPPPAAPAVPAPPPAVTTPTPASRPALTPPAAPAAPAVPPVPAATPPALAARPEVSVAAAPRTPAASPPALDGLVSVSAPYRLIARTSDLTWIRVRTEDGRSSEETLPAGEIREWVSDRPFVVTVGNAGGVSLELNGRAVPPLGPRGVVVPRLVLPPER